MVSKNIAKSLANGSWIRKMFEEGDRLRAIYGDENVYDFSLGNPDGEPPQSVLDSLQRLAVEPNVHKYMANAGFPDVRAKLADYEGKRAGIEGLTAAHVVMSVGAAGGLNAALKALLDPGDEVMVLAPFFVEYLSYIGNHGGVPVQVSTQPGTFQPDPEAIARAITPYTRAMIINNPNNPTGAVYTREILEEVARTLTRREKELGLESPIMVISDEPYAKLVYDGAVAEPMLSIFDNCMVINSFSKSLALPGERIGYIVVNPKTQEAGLLCSALAYTTRVLGYVNAPGLLQKAIAENLDAKVDVDEYRRRRDALEAVLTEAGFQYVKPEGAFYIFGKSPIPDDVAFCQAAAEKRILLVPGTGFGGPGYFRAAYCVSYETILRSREAFLELGAMYR